MPLLEGRLPKPDERKVALVGKDIARTLDKHVGDDITLLGEKFRIIGITNYYLDHQPQRSHRRARRSARDHLPHRRGDLHLGQARAIREIQSEADRVAKAIEGLGQFSVTKSERRAATTTA